MKYLRMKPWLGAGLALWLSWSAQPALADDDLLAAREAWRTRNIASLQAYTESMKGEALGAYPHYWLLSRQLDELPEAPIQAFLKEYEGTVLAERLRTEWLDSLGKAGDWERFRREFAKLQGAPGADLNCYNYSARIAAGDLQALNQARNELWFTAKSLPSACDGVLDSLVSTRTVLEADIWARLRLALEANAPGLARHLVRYLNADIPAATLANIVANPTRYLDNNPALGSRLDRELVIFALGRLGRADREAALARLERLQEDLGREQAYAWRVLAVRGGIATDPRTADWFKRSGEADYTDTEREWRIRAALRGGDWDTVLRQIRQLSPYHRGIRTWIYWEARALEALKQPAEANRILAGLSTEDDYYGLLARDRLGPVMGKGPSHYQANESDMRRLRDNAGLQRAVMLYEMGLNAEGVREWNWALRGADDRLLMAAAEQAQALGWYDRAIYAAERSKGLRNDTLRFPLPYREVVRDYTQQRGLDEAWVYGLMRQESRFVTVARSSVGASGLMQLMPATAQWVAKQEGVRYSAATVNSIENNVRFGTYYLRHVQDKLSGSALMATAGYNAGPNRARAWQGEAPMEAAIYVDTAPFLETRDYMRKVMTGAVLYSQVLGHKPQTLTQRMGVIPARNPEVIEGP